MKKGRKRRGILVPNYIILLALGALAHKGIKDFREAWNV